MDFEWNVWVYCSLLAASVPILIPALQFGFIFRIWDQYNKPVSREMCSCSCWDTVFKAGYETGVSGYKHVYFNCTSNTLVIWTLTVLGVIAIYEAIRHVFTALYYGVARPRMVVLFLSNIYPHYYGWWAYFNYYNDDYYRQWWHQLFFSVTEMASTVTVLHLVNKNNFNAIPRKLLLIISVAFLHIFTSGWDQFVENVLKREGELHQVLRDLGFMLPDLLHVWLSWKELEDVGKRRGVPPSHLFKNQDVVLATASVSILWLLCVLIG